MTQPPVTARPDPPKPGVVTDCPVCGGKMEQVYESGHLKVCVCAECFSGVYIPVAAWDIARMKLQEPPTS